MRDLLAMTAGFPMGFKGVYEPQPLPTKADLLVGQEWTAPGLQVDVSGAAGEDSVNLKKGASA